MQSKDLWRSLFDAMRTYRLPWSLLLGAVVAVGFYLWIPSSPRKPAVATAPASQTTTNQTFGDNSPVQSTVKKLAPKGDHDQNIQDNNGVAIQQNK